MALFDITYQNVQADYALMAQTKSWYLPKALLAGQSQQNITQVQLTSYQGDNSVLISKLA